VTGRDGAEREGAPKMGLCGAVAEGMTGLLDRDRGASRSASGTGAGVLYREVGSELP
jgi:hypothetical protein